MSSFLNFDFRINSQVCPSDRNKGYGVNYAKKVFFGLILSLIWTSQIC